MLKDYLPTTWTLVYEESNDSGNTHLWIVPTTNDNFVFATTHSNNSDGGLKLLGPGISTLLTAWGHSLDPDVDCIDYDALESLLNDCPTINRNRIRLCVWSQSAARNIWKGVLGKAKMADESYYGMTVNKC